MINIVNTNLDQNEEKHYISKPIENIWPFNYITIFNHNNKLGYAQKYYQKRVWEKKWLT